MACSMGRRASSIGLLIVLCLALVSCGANARGGRGGRGRGRGGRGRGVPPNVVTGKEFNVLQFGAVPGGREDSTEGFMHAWIAACSFPSAARVVIPPGVFKVAEIIFSGPCKSPTPIVVQVMGTVRADSDLSNYPDKGWITVTRVNGIMILGGGTLDAQGANMWKYNDCKRNSDCVHLPATLYLVNVQNARIQWVHLVNSMGFHMHVSECQDVRVNHVDITAPAESPNTDGIHVSRSQLVKIGTTNIATGDDCISVGQGAMNVTVKKVTCGPGHGFSVGSLGKLPNELDVRGVIVRNCTLTGTTNGVRIKTFPASDPSRASGIVFGNIVMNNVVNPVIIDQYYGGRPTDKPSRVKISDVTYQDIRGTTTSPVAVNLMCSKLVPCQNLKLINIKLRSIAGMISSACTNAQVGYTGIQNPPPCKR
ncbi:exopolygalacturonase-like [Rhododendron vialii]|uniref:exopolygalacturonase-like n=1 Tax=Rhododendron vialii TaxID=182163 RepID=UPI0026605376|nr:exopolygalacturonase-like [Rhododendron vialii]